MYKKGNINDLNRCAIPHLEGESFDSTELYRPFSHYLAGAPDPTGEHTDLSGTTITDTEEEISAGFAVDIFANPKTNKFDVVEKLGRDRAKKAIEAAKAGEIKND